jgi:hypothetical protein
MISGETDSVSGRIVGKSHYPVFRRVIEDIRPDTGYWIIRNLEVLVALFVVIYEELRFHVCCPGYFFYKRLEYQFNPNRKSPGNEVAQTG